MFTRPKLNRIYNIHNPLGTKHLTRLRNGFSHLQEHNCGNDVETTIFSIM